MQDFQGPDSPEDGKIPTLVAIGSVREGKSSLCNVLAGKIFNHNQFPINGTTKTLKDKVQWGGDGRTFWLIDTPGFSEIRENKDETENSIVLEIKTHSEVNVFAIVLDGSEPRFVDSRKKMIQKFKVMFGDKFLEKNTVFVITKWHYDEDSCATREISGQNEMSLERDINQILKETFRVKNPKGVPVIFLDVHHQDESKEKMKFKKGLDDLENCLKTFPSYDCKSIKSPL